MRLFLSILVMLCLLACVKHAPIIPLSPGKTVQTRVLPPFNRIVVEGDMNVSLHTGYSSSSVILRGHPIDLAQIKMEVQGKRLYLSLGKGFPRVPPLSAEIRLTTLNDFKYRGRGYITGTKLRSQLLDVSIHNAGRTQLGGQLFLRNLILSGGGTAEISGIRGPDLKISLDDSSLKMAGVVSLTHLNLEGDSRIAMYWIRSNALIIRARGHSFIQLGGVAEKLDVELCDTAHFNGKYLRVSRAFVKTHDHSIADLVAIDHQHTLAMDASNIYFYNLPDTRTDFMAYDGSVLDMRDLWPWDLCDYDRYNK